MKKENILDLIEALMDDYRYFRGIGDHEAAEDITSEIEYYLDKAMGDE